MPPKRKTETVAEPSPPPKKRSSRSSSTTDKKRRRDDTVEGATKSRRKKKLEEVEEEEEESEPTTPVATTPKEKKTPKQAPTTPKSVQKVERVPSPPVTALKSASKPKTRYIHRPYSAWKIFANLFCLFCSRKSAVRIDLPPEPSPVPKTAVSTASLASSSGIKTRTPLRMPTTPISPETLASVEPGTDDEKEIVSLWEQTWGALHTSLIMVGPPFLFIILACYFMGTIKQSQAIASVGVVYTFLLLTVLGSYLVVILPCILVARLFTLLVSSQAPERSAAEVNLYSRLLILIGAAAGLAHYFLHTSA